MPRPAYKHLKDRVNLNIDITRKVQKLLDDTMRLADASNRTETIRRAISLYHLVLERQAAGESFFTVDQQGNKKELLLA